MLNQGHSARSLLLAIGVGDFDATMIIPYLFMAPAQTDPQMAQIILMTKQLQKLMKGLGVPLPPTGSIDTAWSPYFEAMIGPDWISAPWAEIIRAAIEARDSNRRLSIGPRRGFIRRGLYPMGDDASGSSSSNPLAPLLDLFSLPSVQTSESPLAALAAAGADGSFASQFKTVGNACKPTTFQALALAKELQAQLNRVARSSGFSTISVDGDIGPGTLSLLGKVIQRAAGSIIGGASTCQSAAAGVDVLASQVRAFADSIGAALTPPAEVAKNTRAGAAIVTDPKTGKTVAIKPPGAAAGLSDVFKAMSTGQKVLFGGLMGGIGFMVYRKVTKSSAPPAKSKKSSSKAK